MNFSFCLIVKNEEKKLDKCLSPLKALDQEIIIVDTGSTDSTKVIALNYTDKVYDFKWINDFSAARNFAIEKASNDYVFFLDADEYVEEYDLKHLTKMTKDYPDAVGQLRLRNNCLSKDGDSVIYIDMVERFFNKKLYHYTGAIHEQVTSLTNRTITAYETNFTAFHDGYIGTPEELKAKGMRNAELLLKDLEKDPSDPYTYYQLGQSYELFNDYDKAYEYYKQGMSLITDYSLKYIKIMTINYGYTLIYKKLFSEALALDNEVFNSYMENADFVCMIATAARESGNLVKAIKYHKLALQCKQYDTEGLNGFHTWHNLGCIYEALGNYEDAINAYTHAGEYEKSIIKCKKLMSNYESLKNQPKQLSIISIISNNNFINEYLEALKNQTIGLCNTELILIDNTNDNKIYSILEDFEKHYSENIILMRNTDNHSAESLYATAFSYTSGEYVLFTNNGYLPVADCFRLLLAGAKSINSDYVKSYYTVLENKDLLSKTHDKLSDDIVSPNTMAIDLNNESNRAQIKQIRLLSEPLNCCIYKCDFIINNNIRFSFDSSSSMSPFESDIYEKSNYAFIIENICFIRIS